MDACVYLMLANDLIHTIRCALRRLLALRALSLLSLLPPLTRLVSSPRPQTSSSLPCSLSPAVRPPHS
eukprot:975519-Rhodomonas_salina.1